MSLETPYIVLQKLHQGDGRIPQTRRPDIMVPTTQRLIRPSDVHAQLALGQRPVVEGTRRARVQLDGPVVIFNGRSMHTQLALGQGAIASRVTGRNEVDGWNTASPEVPKGLSAWNMSY